MSKSSCILTAFSGVVALAFLVTIAHALQFDTVFGSNLKFQYDIAVTNVGFVADGNVYDVQADFMWDVSNLTADSLEMEVYGSLYFKEDSKIAGTRCAVDDEDISLEEDDIRRFPILQPQGQPGDSYLFTKSIVFHSLPLDDDYAYWGRATAWAKKRFSSLKSDEAQAIEWWYGGGSGCQPQE
jgi:hypothetical protein